MGGGGVGWFGAVPGSRRAAVTRDSFTGARNIVRFTEDFVT